MVPRGTKTDPKVRSNVNIRHASYTYLICSVFHTIPQTQMPPHRRITHDDAPSMMPAQPTHTQAHAQAQFSQQQHLQTQTQGSAGSFASLSAGAGGVLGPSMHGGHTRKKARLG